MNAVFRVVTRIQDQDDFSGSLTDGQFLKYNSSTNNFELQSVSPGGDSGQLQYNNSGSFAGVNHSSIGINGDIFKLNSLAVNDIPFVVKGFSGQTGNLTEWRDSSNNVLVSINPSGNLTCSAITASGQLKVGSTTTYLTNNGPAAWRIYYNGDPSVYYEFGNGTLRVEAYNQGWLRLGPVTMYGVLDAIEINNGTTGQYRDLSCRAITASGTITGRASTTAAGTAPISLATGVLMTTPEAGAIEYDGTSLYYTNSGAARQTLATSAALGSYLPLSGGTLTQTVATTGSPTLLTLAGGAHTTLTASTEATDVNFNLARTVQFAAGALTTQRAMKIQAPTYAFVGASTITTASTLSISGAPIAGTNATITNAYALNVESGHSYFAGNVTAGISWNNGHRWSGGSALWESTNLLVMDLGAWLRYDYLFTRAGFVMSRGKDQYIGWSGFIDATNPVVDCRIYSDAAGMFGIRNSTNAQSVGIYGTYTSATSYERVNVRGKASANFEIGPENGSAGGTLRGLTIGGYAAGSATITSWLSMESTTNTSGDYRFYNATDVTRYLKITHVGSASYITAQSSLQISTVGGGGVYLTTAIAYDRFGIGPAGSTSGYVIEIGTPITRGQFAGAGDVTRDGSLTTSNGYDGASRRNGNSFTFRTGQGANSSTAVAGTGGNVIFDLGKGGDGSGYASGANGKVLIRSTSDGANTGAGGVVLDVVGSSTFSGTITGRASTIDASTAPIKLATGVLMTTPEAGAIEYDGTSLYYTNSGAARQTLATSAALGSYLPLSGGTLTGDLLFTDATYDIGKSGATRPRDGFFSRNLTAGSQLTVPYGDSTSPSILITDSNTGIHGLNTSSRRIRFTVAGTLTAEYAAGAHIVDGTLQFATLGSSARTGLLSPNTSILEIRQINANTTAQTLRLNNTWSSSTSFETLQFKANAGANYQIGSAVGSAGGTSRAVNFGIWDATGTFTTALSIPTNGNRILTGTNGSLLLGASDVNNDLIYSSRSRLAVQASVVNLMTTTVGFGSAYIDSWKSSVTVSGEHSTFASPSNGGTITIKSGNNVADNKAAEHVYVSAGNAFNTGGSQTYFTGGNVILTAGSGGGTNGLGGDIVLSAGSGATSGKVLIQQAVSTSGSPTALTITGAAHTTLAASTEATDINFNLARTVQFATGALTTQRAMRIQAPTYSFVGASTITTASTVSISGAPVAGTNATITNAYALAIESGKTRFDASTNANYTGPRDFAEFRYSTNSSSYAVFSDGLGTFQIGSNTRKHLLNVWYSGSATNRVTIGTTGPDNPAFGTLGLFADGVFGLTPAFTVSNGYHSTNYRIMDDGAITNPTTAMIEQRNATTAQSYALYGTWTSATSYERVNVRGKSAANFEIGPESGSAGGTLRGLTIGGYPAGTTTVVGWAQFRPNTSTGALEAFYLGPIADGTAVGGNARGTNAVDLQTIRATAQQVASGSYTFVGSGKNNRASAAGATISGGESNTATGGWSAIGGGEFNSATGISAVIAGGGYHDGLGLQSASANFSAIGGGYGNYATANMAFIPGGFDGLADRVNMTAHGNLRFSARGDNQWVRFCLQAKTTNATPTVMYLYSPNRLTIPTGKILFANILVSGVKSNGSAAACYKRKVAIKNVGGTTSLVGTVETIGTDIEDNALTDVTITADNTNDALDISVTGIATETWRWVCVVEGLEIAYGV